MFNVLHGGKVKKFDAALVAVCFLIIRLIVSTINEYTNYKETFVQRANPNNLIF